jgi:hypothetical protein
MMEKVILIIAVLIAMMGAVKAQEDIDELPDENMRVRFTGLHGQILTSGEYVTVQSDFFRKFLPSEEIPVEIINPVFFLGSISFMRNWFYSNLSGSYSPYSETINGRYLSRLSQSAVTGRVGLNIFKNRFMVISPYAGLRLTVLRHESMLKARKITLEDYMENRKIDLRVRQLSAETGLNINFIIYRTWSLGFYVARLHDLQNTPYVKTADSRISNPGQGNPVKNLLIGIGFGYGGHDFEWVRKK